MNHQKFQNFRNGPNNYNTDYKKVSEIDFFWTQYYRNIANGTKHKIEKESMVFTSSNTPYHLSQSEQLEFNQSNQSISIERSGPGGDIQPLNDFEELKTKIPLFCSENINRIGYVVPTPIQRHSIPLALAKYDLMCCSQTGSGKTFSFLLPMISLLTDSMNSFDEARLPDEPPGIYPKCLILAPTRELANQIFLEAKKICFKSLLNPVVVYGGSDIKDQFYKLALGCDILVATPGRLIDIYDKGILSFRKISFLILDEADRMLDMGFEDQIRSIVQEKDMPEKEYRQTSLFSATFPPLVQSLAKAFLREYVWIGIGRVGSTVQNITQKIVRATLDPQVKLKLLLEAIPQTDGRTLVFVRRKQTASELTNILRREYRIPVDEIHGDKSQNQREQALKNFRMGVIKVLVATDVAARGLDIPAVTHVIQYDLPVSPEEFDTYVHRIGRTGRAGHTGLATAFFVPGKLNGEGHGRIAQKLLTLLKESKQDIPEWFLNLDLYAAESEASMNQSKKAGKAAYQDIRTNQSRTFYSQSPSYVRQNNRNYQNPVYDQITDNPNVNFNPNYSNPVNSYSAPTAVEDYGFKAGQPWYPSSYFGSVPSSQQMQAPRYFNPNNDINSQIQVQHPYHTHNNYRNNAPPQQNFYASNRFDLQNNNQYRADPSNYFEPSSNYGYGAPEFEDSLNSQK